MNVTLSEAEVICTETGLALVQSLLLPMHVVYLGSTYVNVFKSRVNMWRKAVDIMESNNYFWKQNTREGIQLSL